MTAAGSLSAAVRPSLPERPSRSEQRARRRHRVVGGQLEGQRSRCQPLAEVGVVGGFGRRIDERIASGSQLAEHALRDRGVPAQALTTDALDLPFGRGANPLRIGREQFQIEQAVIVGWLLVRRNAQPCAVRIERSGHVATATVGSMDRASLAVIMAVCRRALNHIGATPRICRRDAAGKTPAGEPQANGHRPRYGFVTVAGGAMPRAQPVPAGSANVVMP